MATSKNRWELEEKRKKQQLLQNALDKANVGATAEKLSNAAQTIKKKTTTKSSSTGSAPTVTAPKTNTSAITPATSTAAKTSVFQELPKLAGTVQKTAQTVLQSTQKNNDLRQLQKNSIAWHGTTDAATRSSLQKQNDALRAKLGLSFDPTTGATFDAKTGINYSTPTQLLFGSSAGQRANTAAQAATSSSVRGVDTNAQQGANAHRTMADLYNRAAETWTDADTKNRDNAIKVLAEEMQDIMRAYGMTYSARSTGPNAAYTVSDDEAIARLREAGADETTLAYVQENMDMRNRADRLGRGVEAAAKQFIAGIPALFETARQQSENVEQSRQNPEYVQLEQQEQQLELQLQNMPSQDAEGKVPADYMAVYNQLQEVRQRKNELAVTTPVDPNLWAQTKLREAAEAQADATAGLASVPRFLADTGISIAGNVPTMALAAVPGVGVAAGATLTGLNAAGQRAAELNAQGVSPGEALGRGVAAGVIEAVTEKLPLDEMANLLQTGGTKAVWNILRQMGVEAGEESASYVMNYVADLAANDPDAKFSFAELAQAALGGAVSGGVFGTAGTTIGGRRTQAGPVVGVPEGFTVPKDLKPFYTGGETQSAAAQANSQALGRRMAELDAQKRLAETLLPGPIRDRAIQQAENEMRQVQQQAQATQTATTAQTPPQAEVQIPADAVFQYGLSPEAAALEARERARNEAAQAQAAQDREDTVSVLMQAWTDKRAAEKQAEQTLSGLTLTKHDIDMAQNAARTGVNSQKWEETDNPENAYMYGSALQQVREADKPIRQYFAERADQMQSDAQKAADAIATYAKDKRFGGLYQRETMERNIRDIFGKEHQAEAESIISEYITPVHKAVAQGNRLKNRLRDRVKALKLTKHESALTQMRLEKEDAAAAEYIKNNKIKLTPEMDAKINRAVEEFRSIYNELYNAINQTLLLNGQEPAPFRQNYAPHFVKDTPDTLIGKVRFALGLGKDSSVNIPTDLAGLTDTFRPGKKWFGNLLQREGEITDYDAVAGFDRYVETAADVITLTDSIQKLRALEDQVRYTLSDEGVKAQIDKIKADANLDALAQREQIEKVYDDNRTTVQKLIADIQNQKRMGMGRFVTELRRYTDNLAGKKSREDRGWEDFANRQVYTVAKNLEGRVAANMTSLNPATWITNFIPITQATGEVSVPNLLRGMYQTVKSGIQDDGYVDASTFLTNRYGSQQLDRTLTRKVSDFSGAPMEIFDHIAANTIHRGRYNQNIENGMSVSDAIDEADAFTAALMADRSKGAQPTVFNATNPIRKVFTMFQIEVNNQLSYLFKDMPKAQKQKGVAAVAWAYTKVFTSAYLFNLVFNKITGRDAALDPIGMIARLFGIGDDEDEEKTLAERATGLVEDIGGQIPFVGGILFDGGRVPISSAIPNFANLGKAALPGAFGVEWSGEKRLQTAAKELAKPATYLIPPFGGGAAKKAIEGFATVKAGGSYTYDNQGNLQLQFPAYGQNPMDYAKTMLFGKWSSDEAQEYIDSGFKGLSADETSAYNNLRDNMGVNPRDAMEAILSIRGFESVKDAEGNTVQTVKEQQRMALFDNDALTPEQKAAIDSALIASGEDEMPADYTDRNSFVMGQYINENRQDAARAALESGLTVDQFVQWDDRLSEVKGTKDRFDENQYSADEARSIVLDEVMQDRALTDSEKQAIADYVLISTLGDKQREDWETVAKGKVNATDFLRFKSDISAYEEGAKGTGTDNMANVATILRGYDGLTDEQRDVLFQTYNDTMSNNPFHVSVYEQAITENSLYQSLTEDGKAALRALTNEYEQHINEGRELDEWRAKAYMAEKEAGISPGIYALYRTVLKSVDAQNDNNNYLSQDESEIAINTIPGLTQYQKAYIWQSMNKQWKNNPFGNATVTEYSSGMQEAINPVPTGWAGGEQSGFGPREAPTAGASTWHKALDIPANGGDPVVSIMDGTVTAVNKSGFGGGYGVSVRVDHGNGIETEYHHMQEGSVDNINVGDTVTQGQQIGAVGSTGTSTGYHLDFQVWKDGKIVDPLTVIPGYGVGPSGYVYDGSVASGVISSGVSAAQSEKASSSSKKTGLDTLDTYKSLKGLWM